MRRNAPEIWFIASLIAVALFTLFGPAERSLGTNVRVVYLHGAWVWAALVMMLLAAAAGAAGFATSRKNLHAWSRALGRTGLFFWVTYLPISIWAMQTNWNGLFLAEPRWRVAVIFAVTGILVQAGVTLLENPRWASGANILFIAALILTLQQVDQVMHPSSPIYNSEAWRIQIFFSGLTLLAVLTAAQMARWWRKYELA
jgi:hypothetical protein